MIPVDKDFADKSWCDKKKYEDMYRKSIESPDEFWAEQAERLTWIKKWTRVKNTSFKPPLFIKWFEGAKLNISANCIDRHIKSRANQVALIWEPDSPTEKPKHITYAELLEKVCRISNVLKDHGVKKG